jgi:hypothetical protein
MGKEIMTKPTTGGPRKPSNGPGPCDDRKPVSDGPGEGD